VFPLEDVSPEFVIGILNSRFMNALVHLQANANQFDTGIIERLPWVDFGSDKTEAVERYVSRACAAAQLLHSFDERNLDFVGIESGPTLVSTYERQVSQLQEATNTISEAMCAIDEIVDDAYLVDSSLIQGMVKAFSDEDSDEPEEVDEDTEGREYDLAVGRHAEMWFSYVFGSVFGRWDVALSKNGSTRPSLRPPFEALPPVAPGTHRDKKQDRIGDAFPLARTIVADDTGGKDDIEIAIREITEYLSAGNGQVMEVEALDMLNATSVPQYLRTKFFQSHIKHYSQRRRKAPIYWQLATPSASYSVWIYYHRLTKDTFFKVLKEYVKPKQTHEQKKLDRIRSEAGGEPTRSQRKEIEDQEKFVTELASMAEEVERIAPLWSPNLNDGVIINFAPLWRLVPQNKSWQKECKKVWDKLVDGEYDWAHLAMHLWPERVVPKCVTDASLAIAHGVEDVFWEQDDRDRFQPKEAPQGGWAPVIKKLVDERTSPAVKAALESLLTAPAPAGNSKSRRRKATT